MSHFRCLGSKPRQSISWFVYLATWVCYSQVSGPVRHFNTEKQSQGYLMDICETQTLSQTRTIGTSQRKYSRHSMLIRKPNATRCWTPGLTLEKSKQLPADGLRGLPTLISLKSYLRFDCWAASNLTSICPSYLTLEMSTDIAEGHHSNVSVATNGLRAKNFSLWQQGSCSTYMEHELYYNGTGSQLMSTVSISTSK